MFWLYLAFWWPSSVLLLNLDLGNVPCHSFTAIRGYTRKEVQEVTSFDWSVWKGMLEPSSCLFCRSPHASLPPMSVSFRDCICGPTGWSMTRGRLICLILGWEPNSSVQLLSRVRLFASPWTATRPASLSITNSQSLLKLMSFELMMPSNHLILWRPLLLPPSILPSIRVFSNESVLCIRWPKFLEFQLQNQSFQWTPRTDLL